MPLAIPRPATRPSTPTQRRAIVGATVLTQGGLVQDLAVTLDGGLIDLVGSGELAGMPELDASGLLLLPGIVDLHGDAFERALAPRPGVHLPTPMALAENDGWLLASGITTYFCSITDSFEPGLRSRAQARELVRSLTGDEALPLTVNHRVHLRHERCLTDGHDELCAWLEDGFIHLLSTADHLPSEGDARKLDRYLHAISRRSTAGESEIARMIAAAAANRTLGLVQERDLCLRAGRLGIPLASHDDDGVGMVQDSLARGVAICEFPMDIASARAAQDGGALVLMGSPNWVRGGSHLGAMGVKDALAAGVLDALCSDYHYPSQFHAPFLLESRTGMSLADAWEMVSSRPAGAAGLGNRIGRIAPGYDADLLLVEPVANGLPRLRHVFVGGCEVARFG